MVALHDKQFDLWRFDRRVYWDQMPRTRCWQARARADVVHFTGGTVPIFAPHRVIVTVHDLVWLRGANRGRPYVRWYFGALQPAFVRRAAAIVVDTDAARLDVADGLRIPPERIAVAGAAADDVFFSVVRRPGLARRAVRALGGHPSKSARISSQRSARSRGFGTCVSFRSDRIRHTPKRSCAKRRRRA